MELTIFPRPDVSAQLEKYVEVRLHLDWRELVEPKRILEWKARLTQSTGIPIYMILDPDRPDEPIEQFHGADLGGNLFRAFLERNAK